LLIDVYGQPHGIRGLGITGAIAINFCGAGVLTLWLIFAPLGLPLRGYIVLWALSLSPFTIFSQNLMPLKKPNFCIRLKFDENIHIAIIDGFIPCHRAEKIKILNRKAFQLVKIFGKYLEYLLTVHFISLFSFYSNIRIISTFQLNINFL
jgi:hypothetical protein